MTRDDIKKVLEEAQAERRWLESFIGPNGTSVNRPPDSLTPDLQKMLEKVTKREAKLAEAKVQHDQIQIDVII